MKRLLDVVLAGLGLAVGSVILLPVALALWLQDGATPFYVAPRAGRGGQAFRMVKLRSMRVGADRSGALSTAGDDARITPLGRIVRRWKLDELPQLWNVLRGDMSLVGPRPQIPSATAGYTASERDLLLVRPGITDLASIVFSDEAEILRGSENPDLRYDQIIRPWKSALGLLYVRHVGSVLLDLRLMALTIVSMFSRRAALRRVSRLAAELRGGEVLARVALREAPLEPAPPSGASRVVQGLITS